MKTSNTDPVRLAVAGIGNNILALYQGAAYYKPFWNMPHEDLVGIIRPYIGGLHVSDIEFVGGFDVAEEKIGQPIHEAIFLGKNNYPRLPVELATSDGLVQKGIMSADDVTELEIRRISDALIACDAEVLLYSLPTGLQWAADAYAEAALMAGVALVNCTPETIARNPETLDRFEASGVPLVGDDLASHIGTSIVHRTLLGLLNDRGITLDTSYQLNLGGNADFENLRVAGASKRQSKMNALAQEGIDVSNVEVIPSAGFVNHLQDNKVAYLNIEGAGWAGTPISIDLKLKVQDSSNAAGVIIDLVRIAAVTRRRHEGGFPAAAARILKSPPGGHPLFPDEKIAASFQAMEENIPFQALAAGE